MARRQGRRMRLLLTLPALLLLGVAGAAFAFWAAGGGGSAAATTGTTVPLVLSPGSATAALYPGGSSDVVVTVSNPNELPVRVMSLGLVSAEGTGGFAVTGTPAVAANGCSLTFVRQTNGGVGWTIPAKTGAAAGALSIALPSAIAMGVAAANDCQNRAITVYLGADR